MLFHFLLIFVPFLIYECLLFFLDCFVPLRMFLHLLVIHRFLFVFYPCFYELFPFFKHWQFNSLMIPVFDSFIQRCYGLKFFESLPVSCLILLSTLHTFLQPLFQLSISFFSVPFFLFFALFSPLFFDFLDLLYLKSLLINPLITFHLLLWLNPFNKPLCLLHWCLKVLLFKLHHWLIKPFKLKYSTRIRLMSFLFFIKIWNF